MRLLCVFIFGTVVFPFFAAATDGSVLVGLLGSVYSLSLVGFFLFNFITCISYSGADSVSFSFFFFHLSISCILLKSLAVFSQEMLSSFHSSSLIVHTASFLLFLALHDAAQMINISKSSDFCKRALNLIREFSFTVHRLILVRSLLDPVSVIGADHGLFLGSKLRGFTEIWLDGHSAFYAGRRLQPHRTSRQRLIGACDRTQVGPSGRPFLLNF